MIIEFSVSYSQEEYLSIITDYALDISRKRAKENNPDKKITTNFWFTKKLLRCIGSIAFFYKVRKMPVCKFTFSSDKVIRKTDMDTDDIKWSQISSIAEYSDGMIISIEDNGMPIPYRCIGVEEKQWIIGTQRANSQ